MSSQLLSCDYAQGRSVVQDSIGLRAIIRTAGLKPVHRVEAFKDVYGATPEKDSGARQGADRQRTGTVLVQSWPAA
jgi:hypothetical protein